MKMKYLMPRLLITLFLVAASVPLVTLQDASAASERAVAITKPAIGNTRFNHSHHHRLDRRRHAQIIGS